jgi:hypothetical protein
MRNLLGFETGKKPTPHEIGGRHITEEWHLLALISYEC